MVSTTFYRIRADLRSANWMRIRQKPVKPVAKVSQPAKPFTNSTRLRSAIPDGPLAIHGF
jgi:hypothetical protein